VTSLLEAKMRGVSALLQRHRYVYGSEVELHQQLEDVLRAARLPVQREVRLTAGDRIDLLVGDVGIEVKVKGQRNPVAQLERYAASDRVAGLLLVTTRAATVPETMSGKPVTVVSLLTNGIA